MINFINQALFTIHVVNHSTVDSSWSKTVFPYPNHRIYFITDGEADLYLVDKYIKLKKGNMYLLPAFKMVETICKNSFSHYYLHFQQSSNQLFNLFDLHNTKVEVVVDDTLFIGSLFEKVKENYNSNTINSILALQGSLQLLLAPFFENVSDIDPNIQRFFKVIEHINLHISEDISIDSLSEIVNLNTVYFSNVFSKTFNISPKQYIIEKRLELAQLLLANTLYTVKQIAIKSGFRDDKYFSKLFKSKINMTPIEYRTIVNNTNL